MKLLLLKNIYNNKISYDVNFDYGVYIKNSNNNIFTFNMKFNKLIIENSDNLYIEINKIITSCEIINCNNICIKIIDNHFDNYPSVPCIELYKSDVYLIGNCDLYNDILIMSEYSTLYLIS